MAKKTHKSAAAVLGSKGGKARAKNLDSEQRKAISRKGGLMRQGKIAEAAKIKIPPSPSI